MVSRTRSPARNSPGEHEVFKIVERLATNWRVLNGGATVMALVLAGERFVDGQLVRPKEVQAA